MMLHLQSDSTYLMRPRRSVSVSRITTTPSDYYYVERPRVRSISVEPSYTSYTSNVRPVTVVGSRYRRYTPSTNYYRYYPHYYSYYPSTTTTTYYTEYPQYKYWPYTSSPHYSHYLPSTTYYTRNNASVYDYTLPTSGLRASVPSWVHASESFSCIFLSYFLIALHVGFISNICLRLCE